MTTTMKKKPTIAMNWERKNGQWGLVVQRADKKEEPFLPLTTQEPGYYTVVEVKDGNPTNKAILFHSRYATDFLDYLFFAGAYYEGVTMGQIIKLLKEKDPTFQLLPCSGATWKTESED